MSLDWEPLKCRVAGKHEGLAGWLLAEEGFHMLRTAVPGGWLVVLDSDQTSHRALAFYPDPDHRWDGRSVPLPEAGTP